MKDLIPPCVIFIFCFVAALYISITVIENGSELESSATQMNRVERKLDRLLRYHNLTTEYTKT